MNPSVLPVSRTILDSMSTTFLQQQHSILVKSRWRRGRWKFVLSKKRLNKILRQIATEERFLNNLKFPHDKSKLINGEINSLRNFPILRTLEFGITAITLWLACFSMLPNFDYPANCLQPNFLQGGNVTGGNWSLCRHSHNASTIYIYFLNCFFSFLYCFNIFVAYMSFFIKQKNCYVSLSL